MKVTSEHIDDLMAGAKRVAMENRERAGFSGQFTPVAIVVGPEGQHSVQAMTFRNFQEKRILMRALSVTAREMGVIAIVLVNDTYHVNSKNFTKHFNLAPDLKYDEFKKVYIELLDSEFGGSLANAPKELVSDALIVAMKGPLFKPRVWFLPYHEGVGDSIRWDEEEPEHEGEIMMLEDWWDEPETVH